MISVKHRVCNTPVASAQSTSAEVCRHDIALLSMFNTRQTGISGALVFKVSLYSQAFFNTARRLSAPRLPVITAIVLAACLNVNPASAQTETAGASGGDTVDKNIDGTSSPAAALTYPINVAFLEFLGLVTELDDVGLITDAITDSPATDTATPKTK